MSDNIRYVMYVFSDKYCYGPANQHRIDKVLGKSLIQAKHYQLKKAAKEVNK